MARKKQQTYNDMMKMMGDMREKIVNEKDRISRVLASELDYNSATILGDLSDTELRHIAAFMFSHIELFRNLAEVDTPKPQQLQAAEDKPAVEGELRYNHARNCWEVRDDDRTVGKLRRGMSVEVQDSTDGSWETVRIGAAVQDSWYMIATEENGLDGLGQLYGMFDGLRVRLHNVDN